MSLLISEDQLNIINFNRLISHTNNNSTQELLVKIKENYLIKKIMQKKF